MKHYNMGLEGGTLRVNKIYLRGPGGGGGACLPPLIQRQESRKNELLVALGLPGEIWEKLLIFVQIFTGQVSANA